MEHVPGKFTEGLTDFVPKGGNLISIMGINWFESGNTALGAGHGTSFLEIHGAMDGKFSPLRTENGPKDRPRMEGWRMFVQPRACFSLWADDCSVRDTRSAFLLNFQKRRPAISALRADCRAANGCAAHHSV